ncbi:transcription-repair-coupling factor [Sphingomonas sp. DBB INV C78]|uniref:TRCF domain-containing protein n=1 Tax=Sphingomonas sp. DBB INV C78 TaxID=3349434 RepID=UPI0036D2E6A5
MTSIAFTATRIAGHLQEENIVWLADDDQQAEALAAALKALCPDAAVFFLPSSDALPGDSAPASPANVGARVAVLRALRMHQQSVGRSRLACILSGEAAARRYPPPEAFGRALPRWTVGESIEAGEVTSLLAEIGYVADDRVDEPGEMALRGDVIDIFPADAGLPARIDIADQRIVAIRSYDPVTQRSIGELEALEIGRAAEPPLERATSILAHLGSARLALSPKADDRRRRFIQLATDAARGRREVDAIGQAAWETALSGWRLVRPDERFSAVPRFAESPSPLAALYRFAKPLMDKGRAFVLAGSERDLRFLRGRLGKRLSSDLPLLESWQDIQALVPGEAASIQMPADRGFVDDDRLFVAAADLLGSRALINGTDAVVSTGWSGDGDIRIGDVVVHEDHGVAIVAGLEPAPSGDESREMIALEFAGGGRRLTASDEADRIWRYGADTDAVTLDKLDGSTWRKRRDAIDAAIAESAADLAALAEARERLVAPVIDPDPAAYERFVSGFPFNETADQARAITAVCDDLARGKPMDRLVVGDVGYGKTEIAMRAAALTALAGYQVVIAAPTTVLVQQHLASFRTRFEAFGITVAGLSRLSSAAEKKAVKAGLADGSIGIVIGTGAVMAGSVRYARPGLIVIDEEQRFGAADKARMRGSGDMHLLTLSATPIPRTLQSALIGLQQISIIATPPARRQPIRTSLDQPDDGRIRTALLREKGRGGQSFLVVPRIEDMAKLAERLGRIVPELGIVAAHGKMATSDIDAVMVGFAQGDGDVLLATNIIEAGLDVPRANTMIIWNADRFGLAQLHQLRGRVGRGNRRGQVILLTAGEDRIAERTMKRLRTLAAFDRLGAGFDISASDLDMRGGGELLGESQAGHIKLIGVDLYQHLLGLALRAARGETIERWSPELNLGASGCLPESWIPEPDARLALYVRLARLESEAGLDAFEEELIDRFGPLPASAERLMVHARVRLAARSARIARIDAGPAAIAITPRRDFRGDTAAIGLTRKMDRFLLAEAIPEEQRIDRVQALIEALAA